MSAYSTPTARVTILPESELLHVLQMNDLVLPVSSEAGIVPGHRQPVADDPGLVPGLVWHFILLI